MGRTLEEVLNSLSPEMRARVEKRTAALEAEYEAMQQLKKLIDMADWEVDQELVNTPELISKLREYVETLGGSLDITINLPGKAPVRL